MGRAGTVAWRVLGMLALAVALWWLLRQLMPVVLPVIAALLLAALLRPVAAALERRGASPALAALAAMALAVAVLVLAAVLIVPPFIARIGALGDNLEEGVRQVVYSVAHDVAGASHEQADHVVDSALRSLSEHRSQLLGDVLNGATAVIGAFAASVLIAFLCFFGVKDGARITTWLIDWAPPRRQERLARIAGESWRALTTYIRGVVFVATVDAVFIGLALVLVGVPLALPLIVLTWVGAFFPIVGAVTAGAAAALVALVADGFTAALVVTGAIVLVQQLEGNVLYPMVVGPRLRLHPVVILLAVTAGGTVAGLAGAFMAVPVATVAAVVLADVRRAGDPAPHVDVPRRMR